MHSIAPAAVVFEANEGQAPAGVLFELRDPRSHVLLGRRQVQFPVAMSTARRHEAAMVTMEFVGGNTDVDTRGERRLAGTIRYVLGDRPELRDLIVPAFAAVRYGGIFPGVDAVFHGDRGAPEYDFIVWPHADTGLIQLSFRGADALEIDGKGDLIVRAGNGELRHHKPRAHQTIDGRKREVAVAFRIERDRIGFAVGSYDRNVALIIDPLLEATVLPRGDGLVGTSAVAVDAQKNVYIAGQVNRPSEPWDAMLRKYTPDLKQILYTLYFGGSAYERVSALAIDASGAAYVGGYTNSLDFPLVGGLPLGSVGGSDGFVTKVSPSGDTLVYSTLLAGQAEDYVNALAVDGRGRVHAVGWSESTDFPTTAAPLDPDADLLRSFVARLSIDGTRLVYSRLLYTASDLAIDSNSEAVVIGSPSGGGLQVLKLTSTGMVRWRKQFAASGSAVAIDKWGSIVIGGVTASRTLGTSNGLRPYFAGHDPHGQSSSDGFILRLTSVGRVIFGTYLGFAGTDSQSGTVADVSTDSAGNIYAVGHAGGSQRFTTLHSIRRLSPTQSGPFALKMTRDGRLAYSTLLGNGDSYLSANSVAAGAGGAAYVAGLTKMTPGQDWPFYAGSYLLRLGTPSGVDVGVFVGSNRVQPVAGAPHRLLVSVANGARRVRDAAIEVTAPPAVRLTNCSAERGGTCQKTSNGWVVRFDELAPVSTRRIRLRAVSSCSLPNGASPMVTAGLTSTHGENASARGNNVGTAVIEIRNEPPIIEHLTAAPAVIAPDADAFVRVAVDYDARDDCGAPPTCTLSVSSTDPTATSADWMVISDHEVRLRAAQRLRAYGVQARCVDRAGNVSMATTWVQVRAGNDGARTSRVRAGSLSMSADFDDENRYELFGDDFQFYIAAWSGANLPTIQCHPTCEDGGIADLTQRIVLHPESSYSTATVRGVDYGVLELRGELVVTTGKTVVPTDVTPVPNTWRDITAPFVMTGRIAGYSAQGAKLFELRVAGSGPASGTLDGTRLRFLHFVFSDIPPPVIVR